ncbi:MAG: G2-specific serine/threonine protein kinase [Trichoglossum hirsutum]|nr:MAG: G2-specific serine/threonine protein kinase [Trichoglossum hirsutum]
MLSEEYVQVKKIGYGSFGTVHMVRRSSDGKMLARKDIRTDLDSDLEQRWLQTEIEALKRMSHPNIVQFVHVEPHSQRAGWWRLYQEFCDRGSLEQFIEDMAEWDTVNPLALHKHELFVWKVAFELGLAMSRCHYGLGWDDDLQQYVYVADWTPVLHRDVKPANVLLMSSADTDPSPLTYCVKLADFGMSYFLDSDAKNPSTYGGTKPYWAPVGFQIKGHTADLRVWDAVNPEEVVSTPVFRTSTIYSSDSPFPSVDVAERFQKKLRGIVRGCLAADPSLRLNGLELAIRASEGIKELGRLSPELSSTHHKLIRLQDLSDRQRRLAKSSPLGSAERYKQPLPCPLPGSTVLTTVQLGSNGSPQQQLYGEHRVRAMILSLVSLAIIRDAEIVEERKNHQRELEEMRRRMEDAMGKQAQRMSKLAFQLQDEINRSTVEYSMLKASVEEAHKRKDEEFRALIAKYEVDRREDRQRYEMEVKAAVEETFKRKDEELRALITRFEANGREGQQRYNIEGKSLVKEVHRQGNSESSTLSSSPGAESEHQDRYDTELRAPRQQLRTPTRLSDVLSESYNSGEIFTRRTGRDPIEDRKPALTKDEPRTVVKFQRPTEEQVVRKPRRERDPVDFYPTVPKIERRDSPDPAKRRSRRDLMDDRKPALTKVDSRTARGYDPEPTEELVVRRPRRDPVEEYEPITIIERRDGPNPAKTRSRRDLMEDRGLTLTRDEPRAVRRHGQKLTDELFLGRSKRDPREDSERDPPFQIRRSRRDILEDRTPAPTKDELRLERRRELEPTEEYDRVVVTEEPDRPPPGRRRSRRDLIEDRKPAPTRDEPGSEGEHELEPTEGYERLVVIEEPDRARTFRRGSRSDLIENKPDLIEYKPELTKDEPRIARRHGHGSTSGKLIHKQRKCKSTG